MLSRMRPARALATRAAAAAEEFATGTSSAYADAQYLAWQRDPASVHSSWASYFASGAFALPPQLGGAPAAGAAAAAQVPAGDAESTLQGLTGADTARAMHLIAAYQRRGHERADLDPLRLAGDRPRLRDLDPATYGFEPGDADRPLRLASAPGSAVAGCVEINQCVGCTRAGVASMATQDERAVTLISTQVAGLLGNADVNDDGLTTLAELDDFLRDTYRAVWKSTSASGHALAPSSGEEPTSPRRRAGVASMAWRSTRRSRTNAP